MSLGVFVGAGLGGLGLGLAGYPGIAVAFGALVVVALVAAVLVLRAGPVDEDPVKDGEHTAEETEPSA